MKTATQMKITNDDVSYIVQYVGDENQDLVQKWQDFVVEHDLPPQSSYLWKKHLESVFNAKAFAIAILDNNCAISGFAIVYFTPSSEILYSCRYGVYALTQDVALALQDEIQKLCHQYNLRKSVITSGSLDLELSGKMTEKDSLYLPLKYANAEELWLSIPKKTKNMIRKAEKSGFTVTDDWAYLRDFYKIYTDRFLEKSLNIKPFKHFSALKDMFGDDAFFIGVLQEKELVAGMVFISTEHVASYAYNASIVNALNNGTNNLLMWEAMQRLHSKGVKYIDLSESTLDSPVYKFKNRLSKDVEERKTYYYDVLSGTDLPNLSMQKKVFLKYKVQGILHRLLPIMPEFLKRKYLAYSGKSGRVI